MLWVRHVNQHKPTADRWDELFYCFHQFLELFSLLPILQHHRHQNTSLSLLSFHPFLPKVIAGPLLGTVQSHRQEKQKSRTNTFPISSFHQDSCPCICEKTQGPVTRGKLAAQECTAPLGPGPTAAASDRQDQNLYSN